MKIHKSSILPLVVSLIYAVHTGSLSAELPMLEKQPWIGYFAVFQNKNFQLGVTNTIGVTLIPLNDKNEPIGKERQIPILVAIEETQADGKSVTKTIVKESLTSADPATEKLTKATIKGKVTGDATFELTIEQNHGIISIGGRILEPGSLKRESLKLSIQAKFPKQYDKDKKETKDEIKAFEKKLKDDRINLVWTDGKRKKLDFKESVNAPSPEVNGPGIASAEIEITGYGRDKFVFVATPNSAMTLSNEKTPLHEGFTIKWLADPAKDPEGKARLNFEIK
ncbi:MAG: hypothetical protein H8M99_11750 [Gloeobacteraceae cyanobacterium ES-bin-144]|nr:hypothetical protein [Verrucomicrobiales bacterium]